MANAPFIVSPPDQAILDKGIAHRFSFFFQGTSETGTCAPTDIQIPATMAPADVVTVINTAPVGSTFCFHPRATDLNIGNLAILPPAFSTLKSRDEPTLQNVTVAGDTPALPANIYQKVSGLVYRVRPKVTIRGTANNTHGAIIDMQDRASRAR